MTESAPDTGGLDAIATDATEAPYTFTRGGRTGTMRPTLFGDLRAMSHAKSDFAETMVLIERVTDAEGVAILDALPSAEVMAIFRDYQTSRGLDAGK